MPKLIRLEMIAHYDEGRAVRCDLMDVDKYDDAGAAVLSSFKVLQDKAEQGGDGEPPAAATARP